MVRPRWTWLAVVAVAVALLGVAGTAPRSPPGRALSSSVPDGPHAPRLALVDGGLVVQTGDRGDRSGEALVGTTWSTGGRVLRVVAARRDRRRATAVWLYDLVEVGAAGLEMPVCQADPTGARWAVVVPGDNGGLELACTSGAIGKCARWGYPPAPDDHDGAALHAACVRMARADYGGDERSWTRAGERIGFCDRLGRNRCRPDAVVEAGWSPAGAVCLGVPRLAARAAVITRYPHLAGAASACHRARLALDTWLLSTITRPGPSAGEPRPHDDASAAAGAGLAGTTPGAAWPEP